MDLVLIYLAVFIPVALAFSFIIYIRSLGGKK